MLFLLVTVWLTFYWSFFSSSFFCLYLIYLVVVWMMMMVNVLKDGEMKMLKWSLNQRDFKRYKNEWGGVEGWKKSQESSTAIWLLSSFFSITNFKENCVNFPKAYSSKGNWYRFCVFFRLCRVFLELRQVYNCFAWHYFSHHLSFLFLNLLLFYLLFSKGFHWTTLVTTQENIDRIQEYIPTE